MAIITKSITDQIYNIIKEKILFQEYKIGSKIDMKEIAEEHEISIMPVRDALKRLSNQGLVVNKSRVGFFVKEFSEEEIENIMEVRNMYETYCLEHHFDNLNFDEIKSLYEDIQCQDSLRREKFDEVDSKFHNIIINSSENQFLIEHYEKIEDRIILFRHLDKERIKKANEEHCMIIESILNGEKNEAVNKLNEHIRNVSSSAAKNIED